MHFQCTLTKFSDKKPLEGTGVKSPYKEVHAEKQ